MIAIDHRQAPDPSYTIRSSSPRTILTTCRVSPKAQAKITTTPISLPATAISPSGDVSFLPRHDGEQEIVPGVQEVTADELSVALKHLSQTELPDSNKVFPWLHCIRSTNTEQKHFFRVDPQTGCPPPTTWRGITLVHCTSGLPQERRLVGAVEPGDLLKAQCRNDSTSAFINLDPQWGIHLRNFGLQHGKTALLSDLVVYRVGDTQADKDYALSLCKRLVEAQRKFRDQQVEGFPIYRTFLVDSNLDKFISNYPELVTDRHDLHNANHESDFLKLEREQMHIFAHVSKVSQNLYMGDDQDWLEITTNNQSEKNKGLQFDIHVHCDDSASLPRISGSTNDNETSGQVLEIAFPSSSAFSNSSQQDIEAFVNFCSWLYSQTHSHRSNAHELCLPELYGMQVNSGSTTPETSSTGALSDQGSQSTDGLDLVAASPGSKKVLMTCRDGYTETTFLALAYIVYANCITLDDAWLHLHNDKRRDFYAFTEDLMALRILFPALISASPYPARKRAEILAKPTAAWFESQRSVGWSGMCESTFSGSLPSRILDHLYLGNLQHANNIGMLRAIGVTRVLSVGENPTAWGSTSVTEMPNAHLYIDSLHDDGIDSLEPEIERCLQFIAEGLAVGQKTLVHCRVGVSRSASICIAEVVRRRRMSIEDAYLFTRARRLNVIIQPNLRFMYELVKWTQKELSRDSLKDGGGLVPRTIEWPVLCDEIARLNRYYIQQK